MKTIDAQQIDDWMHDTGYIVPDQDTTDKIAAYLGGDNTEGKPATDLSAKVETIEVILPVPRAIRNAREAIAQARAK